MIELRIYAEEAFHTRFQYYAALFKLKKEVYVFLDKAFYTNNRVVMGYN